MQAQLDTPGDVALAARLAKVAVAPIRLPGLIDRAEEDAVQSVARIGFEAEVFVLSQVGIFIEGNILVEVLESAHVFVLS